MDVIDSIPSSWSATLTWYGTTCQQRAPFFFPTALRKQRGSRSRKLSRRLITLIFAGRNRIIVIRRELPRT